MMEGPQCRFRREARARERHQHPVVDGLKVFDPKRPIREADMARTFREFRVGPRLCEPARIRLMQRSKWCYYSITSSAATSRDCGTARSSILAVWALMTSSNLLACTTGKSAGFAPLRMRAT